MSKVFPSIAAVLAAAAVASAQQPPIDNGRVTSQAVTTLEPAFTSLVESAGDVTWIGYAVPIVDGERTMCCFNSGGSVRGHVVSPDGACCGMCRLEPSAAAGAASKGTPSPAFTGPIKLEGPGHLVVLVRVANRQVERVRAFSEGCALDAGGREVAWLTGVRPSESVALLQSLVSPQAARRDRVTDGAISAIALHQDPAADAALERLLATTQPSTVREKIPFWLGNARGARGLALLQRVIREDPSAEVRKKAVFGISQSREANALDVLIDNARTHADGAVRSEAVFWLAQKAGEKAVGAISERIEQDPDTEVKKRAVFALSQLPADEGVPRLIQVARTHSNPAVKKQAMFWLGQSKDRRALDFFAEILK